MAKFNVTCCHITASSTTRHIPFTVDMHIVNYTLANSINQRHLHETIRWVEMESRTLKKACFRQKPEAQCAFKILMIHEVLQFALRIAFRCVLHRWKCLDIHRWKLYTFILLWGEPEVNQAHQLILASGYVLCLGIGWVPSDWHPVLCLSSTDLC